MVLLAWLQGLIQIQLKGDCWVLAVSFWFLMSLKNDFIQQTTIMRQPEGTEQDIPVFFWWN